MILRTLPLFRFGLILLICFFFLPTPHCSFITLVFLNADVMYRLYTNLWGGAICQNARMQVKSLQILCYMLQEARAATGDSACRQPLRCSRLFKVTDVSINRKLTCDLVININLHPILHRFQVIAEYWSNLRFPQGSTSL